VIFSKDHHAGLRHAVVRPLELPSLTRNPWDLGKNPGGSSSGAGAAAAAGYGPLHLGPTSAARCGCPPAGAALVALKPSLGRHSVDPPYVGRVAGPMTARLTTLHDDERAVAARSPRRHELPPMTSTEALDKPLRKLRIGLMLDLGVGQALEKDCVMSP